MYGNASVMSHLCLLSLTPPADLLAAPSSSSSSEVSSSLVNKACQLQTKRTNLTSDVVSLRWLQTPVSAT